MTEPPVAAQLLRSVRQGKDFLNLGISQVSY
jgi:hypothetical protein